MDVFSTREFLEAREKKLGSAIIWKSYAVWHASINGDKREYGVFLYTDGKTLVFEDFERTPTLMGIPVASIKKEKYEKYEVMVNISEIKDIYTVTRSSAESSVRNMRDASREPSFVGKLFKKLVTKVSLFDGRVYFFEMMDASGFKKKIMELKKGE